MRKKQVLALMMSVATIASAFAGTGISAAAESADDMTITVMGIDWGYGPVANSQMEQYWEELLGVNLDIQWVSYQDYDQKLNTLIAANSQPDVIQINKVNGNYYYPILTQAIDAGNFVDLTDYLFADGNGVAETNAVMKNWDENFWVKQIQRRHLHSSKMQGRAGTELRY